LDMRAADVDGEDHAFLSHVRVLASGCAMPTQISVVGSGAEHVERAQEVGRLLAEQGATVVTGGLGEVMAAASRGAKGAGGTTIGILPGETPLDGEPQLARRVWTGRRA